MQNKSILFYWSRGAEVRRKILRLVHHANQKNKPAFLNALAKTLKLSHVAVKKHVDLLLEEGFLEEVNPGGKPIYLRLSKNGATVLSEFSKN
ncbi:helix-turn-helix domain-containing protein [Candidatus Micrarchaeota archaeon]|nr:helix-turn-helix domain-containing protein [Candidatus Micrarchaeota archaeon]